MSYKAIVLEKYPGAEAQHYEWLWVVYSPTVPLGSGRSAAQAWAAAAKVVRKRDAQPQGASPAENVK